MAMRNSHLMELLTFDDVKNKVIQSINSSVSTTSDVDVISSSNKQIYV